MILGQRKPSAQFALHAYAVNRAALRRSCMSHLSAVHVMEVKEYRPGIDAERLRTFERKGRRQSMLLVALALLCCGPVVAVSLTIRAGLAVPAAFLLAATAGISSLSVP